MTRLLLIFGLFLIFFSSGAAYAKDSTASAQHSTELSSYSTQKEASFTIPADYTKELSAQKDNYFIAFTPVSAYSKNAETSDNTLLYRDVQPETNIIYQALDYGLKESIILKSASSPKEFSWQMKVSENLTIKRKGQSLAFFDKLASPATSSSLPKDSWPKEKIFEIPAPFMVDATGRRSDNLKFEIKNLKLTLTLDEEFLKSAVYPVVIDPTIVYNTSAQFANGTYNRVVDTGSGSSPNLTTNYRELPADINTVGLWHLNEASGNALDSSGNSNTGTPTGTTVVPGILGNARSFNGISDYISLGNNKLGSMAGSFTIESWINTTLIGSNEQIIFSEYQSGVCGDAVFGIRGTTGYVYFHDGTGSNTTGNRSVGDGRWHHIAYVYNGSQGMTYVDGIPGADTTATTWANRCSSTDVRMGSLVGGSFFAGIMDEFRVSNIARTPEEIKADATRYPYSIYTSDVQDINYAKTWNPLQWSELGVGTGDGETLKDTTGLVAQWNFNETSSTTASVTAGSCGASCNGTLTNFASTGSQDAVPGTGWTTKNARWPASTPGALMFDGSDDYISIPDDNSQDFNTGSLEAWVKPSALNTYNNPIIYKASSNTYTTLQYSMYINGNYQSVLSIYGASSTAIVTGTTILSPGNWYYIVGTFNGTSLNIYVNGKLDATAPQTTNPYNTGAIIKIGADTNNGTNPVNWQYFKGVIDSTRIYSRALTLSEILSNYNSGNIELQTRVGNTSSPDATWEEWKPITGETAIDSMDNNELNTHVYNWAFNNIGTNQTWVKSITTTPNDCNSGSSCSGGGQLAIGSSGNGDIHINSSSVIQDGSTYKMWYSGSDGTNDRIFYATSPDGQTWTKYDNTIPSNSDTTGTNGRIPLGTAGKGDSSGASVGTVIKDGSIYKMWYLGNNSTTNSSIYYATSSDGLTWTKQNNNYPGTCDSGSACSYGEGRMGLGTAGKGDNTPTNSWSAGPAVIKDGSTYKMWYSGFDNTNYRIYYATSSDGLTWTKYDNTIPAISDASSTNGRIPIGNSGRGDSLHVLGATIIKDGPVYKMWYAGHQGGSERIFYATSHDGLTWIKYDNTNPVVSGSGSPVVLAYIKYPTVIKDNGIYKMWYSANDYLITGHNRKYYASMTPLPIGESTDTTIKSEGTASERFNLGQPQVDSGTVGLWHLDETSGTGAYLENSSVPTINITDSFNRVNSSSSLGSTDSGHAWTTNNATWGITSNQAYVASGCPAPGFATIDSGTPDGVLQVTLATNHQDVIIPIRFTSWSDTYFVNNDGGGYRLKRRQSNAETTLGSYDTSPANGDVVKIELKDSSFKVYINGTLRMSATDSNLTSTKHGIGTWCDNSMRFDDFSFSNSTINGNGTPTGTTVVDGFYGKARSFDGVTSTNITGPRFPSIYDNFTMELWVYPTATRTSTVETNSVINGNSGQRYAVWPDSGYSGCSPNDKVGAGISVGTNGISVAEHVCNYLPILLVYDAPISGWNHVAVVYQNKQPKLYLNGVLVRTGLTSTKEVHPSAYFGDQNSNYGPFSGKIDEYRVSSIARTADEISESYRAGRDHRLSKTITSTDLSAKTKLPFYVASDRQGQFMEATVGNNAYVNYEPDGNTVGLWHMDETPPPLATGGTVTYSGGYTIHTFTGSGTFTPSVPMNVETLVVAGGGGGYSNLSGAGGAGGVIYNASFGVTPQTYSITVGNGGGGNSYNGQNSVFSTLTAIGGGRGGSRDAANWAATGGGSGGGGNGLSVNPASPGAGTSGQGYAGGTGYGVTVDYGADNGGGGGGGGGGVGANGAYRVGGNGGVGVANSISGSSVYYAGGGGGCSYYTYGTGGNGGGGSGTGVAGTANTGGGGGGGGAGGSGIVIIRYPSSSARDSSSYGNNGALAGTTSVQGKIGKARSFNGTSDYVTVGNLGGFPVLGTLEFWINSSEMANWRNPLTTKYNGGNAGIRFEENASGNFNNAVGNDAGTFDSCTYFTSGMATNTWYNIVYTWDTSSNQEAGYLNGVRVCGGSHTLWPTTIPDLRFGTGFSTDAARQWKGSLDEVRISNVARSADDIRAAYEVGKRTHPIIIDFKASLDAANLITNSSDLSFTIDSTKYGAQNKGDNLYKGDKVIVKENVGGTDYIAQGTVTAITPSSGAVTVLSWDAGSTFPTTGFSIYATVFKWQREYFDLTGSLPSQRNAVTRLTLRMTDGSQGANIWLDDFKSNTNYLTTPAGSTILSSLGNRYFQYRAILTSTDTNVSPSLASTTTDYVTNYIPNAPTLSTPANGASGATAPGITPTFQLSATDDDSDILKYKLQIDTVNTFNSGNLRTLDQTSSITDWSAASYASGATATYTVPSSSPLSANTQYYWRAYAIDPLGKNLWSSVSSTYSFTTNTKPNAPTTTSPVNGARGTNAPSILPTLTASATDTNDDYLRYKIELATNSGFTQNLQTFTQPSGLPQTGWSGQNGGPGGNTAYTSGTNINYTLQSALTLNTTYYWRVSAIDPVGSNTWSVTSATVSFTTFAPPGTPTLSTPADNVTNLTVIPNFTMSATDVNNDNVVYKVTICTDAGMSLNCVTKDQSVDTTGWLAANYASGATASFTLPSVAALVSFTDYYWNATAKDPTGTNTWGTTSVVRHLKTSHTSTGTITAPINGLTNQVLSPLFKITATDADVDDIKYKIVLCTNLAMTQNCQTFAQTVSQTGWSGQNSQSQTAYTSGTTATYILQAILTNSATYYWQTYAIDLTGSNSWTVLNGTPYSFVTQGATGNLSCLIDDSSKPGSTVIKWSDQFNNESGYEIERNRDLIGFSSLITKVADSTSHTDSTTSGGYTYQYRVRANFADLTNSDWCITSPANYSVNSYSHGGLKIR